MNPEPDVDDIVAQLSNIDLGRLAANAETRTQNLKTSIDWEREKYRDMYKQLHERLETVDPKTLAQDFVNFDRFDWKLDWVMILTKFSTNDDVWRAFAECQHVKLDGEGMLAIFTGREDLIEVFVTTLKKGFYALDMNTRAIHFARLPYNMYAAAISSPSINFAGDVKEILESDAVSPENKRATYETYCEDWMNAVVVGAEREPYITEFLETSACLSGNDATFVRKLCTAVWIMTH